LAAGRRVLTVRGPLHRFRLRALEHGDLVFSRHPVLGILLAPSPLSGIHRVRPAVYLTTTFVAAAVWAAGLGVGAYFAGPPIVEWVNDEGTVAFVGLIVLVVGTVAAEAFRRRRRRAAQREPERGASGL
jgi:membrane protein DedA with SNARE-associated domain